MTRSVLVRCPLAAVVVMMLGVVLVALTSGCHADVAPPVLSPTSALAEEEHDSAAVTTATTRPFAQEVADSIMIETSNEVGKEDTSCAPHYAGFVTVARDKSGRAKYTYHGPCNKSKPKDAVAWGTFDDVMQTTGWGELNIRTSSQHSDLEQSYAAGYLEGSLTHARITQIAHFVNHAHSHEKTLAFVEQQDAFLRKRVQSVDPKSSKPIDWYWYSVALILAQLDGVLQGHNDHVPSKEQRLTKTQMWLMNSDGDVLDIERAAPHHNFKRVVDMTKAELIELVSIFGHCSLLVKLTDKDLFVAHNTWDDYGEMLRIYKHYHFDFKHPSIRSRKSSHSSYPGFISSSDDFYVLDTGLAVTETTLNILNDQLYNLLDPSSTVFAWVRNLVANRLARNGKEWTDIFKQYNSGTYNDQWAIVDYKLYKPGQKLQPGTLYIMEQIPGYVEVQDMTHLLEKEGYWGSYNRPFFKTINEKSMYTKYTKEHGVEFSYKDCPRAKIFQRDHSKVKDLESMKKLMRQNNFQNDPLSLGCPGNAIAARFDIEAPNCQMSRVANGATDAKITSSSMIRKMSSVAISGPPADDQPPFSWKTPMWAKENHQGQPDQWNFSWQSMSPKSL